MIPFWEPYNVAIHENSPLSPVENFNYLGQHLGGDAASAIKGVPTTQACYNGAIDILTMRFGEREQLSNII